MSGEGAIVVVAIWCVIFALVPAVVYALLLRRYESGRKVNIESGTAERPAPRSVTRIPKAWPRLLSVWWVLGVIGWVVVSELAARGMSSSDRDDISIPLLLWFLGSYLAGLLALLLVAAWHNHNNPIAWPDSGWYTDPYDSTMLRWWNGIEWLDYTYPVARYAPSPFADSQQ